MVFIDYLQLLLCDKNDLMTRNEEIDYILRTMKDMAKELDITVVVMSQLQRKFEISNDSQLLESSNFKSAEQYADVILFMNRNRITNNDNEIIDFMVTKNENGETRVAS